MPDRTVDELWQGWKQHADHEARGRLVVHYSPLVKFVAGPLRSTMPAHVEQDDLISDGVIGLIDAVEKFDPARGHQFQTYAVRRIHGAIIDGLRSADWVPRSTRAQIRAQDRAAAELESRLGRAPTIGEIGVELDVTPEAVRRTRDEQARASTIPLEAEADEPSVSASGPLPGDGDALPEGFAEAMRALPERDQIVLALYYWERLTLAEIGRVLGVTESRVSQLHSRATASLGTALAAER